MGRLRRVGSLAALTAAVLASGCASGYLHVSWPTEPQAVSSIGNERIPKPAEPLPYYMGTRFVAYGAARPFLGPDSPSLPEHLRWQPEDWWFSALCLVDLPFSAVLDTVLLPVDAWSHWRHRRELRAYAVAVERARASAGIPASPPPDALGSSVQGAERARLDPDLAVRLETVRRLESHARAEKGRTAVRTLIGFLRDEDEKVRLVAAAALSRLGETPVALPVLVDVLENADPRLRRDAALALAEAAGTADVTAAAPALGRTLGDADEKIANVAFDALRKTGAKAIPVLVESLRSGAPSARARAQFLLRVLGAPVAPAVPELFEIARVPLSANALYRAMEARSDDRDAAIWRAACSAVPYGGAAVVPAVIDALDDPSGAVRLCAVVALVDLQVPSAALPALEARLRDPELQVQFAARAALERYHSR